jgi:hypothetical protein
VDPASYDFVDRTIAALGLTAQHRELAEATRWLDPADRELLALWWLESSGHLGRVDLVVALGQPPALVAGRVGRLRARVRDAHMVVRVLAAQPRCPLLAQIAATWDEQPTPLWGKRFGRHLRDCVACAVAACGLVEPERLLYGLPLVPGCGYQTSPSRQSQVSSASRSSGTGPRST